MQDLWILQLRKRFTTTYIVALGILAAFALCSLVLSIYHLRHKDISAHLVNVAGRQRMLSEQLAKLALLSRDCMDEESCAAWSVTFDRTLAEWESAQIALRSRDESLGLGGQNSTEIRRNLEKLEPTFTRFRSAARGLQSATTGHKAPHHDRMEPHIQQILAAQPQFLLRIDQTVELYERDANMQASRAHTLQMLLSSVMVILIIVSGLFIFRPAGQKITHSVETLRDSERRFHAFMENSPVIAFMKDEAGRYIYVNRALRRELRMLTEDWVGRTDAEIFPEQVAKRIVENDAQVLSGNRNADFLDILPGEKGDSRYWLSVKFPFVNQSGAKFLGGTSIDITERVLAEEALRASEKRWQLALRGSNDGLWDWNALTNEVYFSARWKQMLGYADEEISNVTDEWDSRVHPDDAPRVRTELEAHLNRITPYYVSEYRMRRRDGTYLWVLARGQAVWDEHGKAVRLAGSHTDITERKKAEAQLSHDAAHDALTQLSNRRRLLEQVEASFRQAREDRQPLSICICDIDHFKQVNDTCGHAVGDRVLSTFAQILRESLRTGDIAGRLGGDEFCMILAGTSLSESEAIIERVRSKWEALLFAQRDGKPFHVSATFGVAQLLAHHASVDDLMEAADLALYQGKSAGRNRVSHGNS